MPQTFDHAAAANAARHYDVVLPDLTPAQLAEGELTEELR